MSDIFDSHDIATDAGIYRVDIVPDYDSENPLTDWDHEGMTFAAYHNGQYEALNTLSGPAGDVVLSWIRDDYDDEDIERRFATWRAITGDTSTLYVTRFDTSQSDWYRMFVVVDADSDYPDPMRAAIGAARNYAQWLRGEVYGFATHAPDGSFVGSVWGYYDRGDALADGRGEAESDAITRQEYAARAGAGFIGII
jgi:hypothetical protein